MKYFTMKHCGGLKEAMQTLSPIEKTTFDKLVKEEIYIFYAYDERIKARRYILKQMEKNYGLPVWLILFDEDYKG